MYGQTVFSKGTVTDETFLKTYRIVHNKGFKNLAIKTFTRCEFHRNISFEYFVKITSRLKGHFTVLSWSTYIRLSPYDVREKSLHHVAMVAKFLDANKTKPHLKSKYTLFQTS